MKTNRLLLLLSLVTLLLSSCQKDSVTFRLRFKGFNHDAKVYIDDNRFPQWIPEVDAINVNGVEYPVSNSSQGNTVTVATSANYLAVYPNSVYQSISGNEAALLIPEHQLYRTAQVGNEAVQVVEAPMSAKVSSGTTLVFENAGALLAINVVNDYGQGPLMVDSIIVSASAMALWGDAALDFSQSTPAYTITSQVEDHNTVTLSSINHVLEASGHKVFYIYVPATPSGVNNLFTISVSAHSSDHEGTFTRSQTTANAGNIVRGDMAAFDFNLEADEVTKVWARSAYPNGTIRGGKFSISSTKKVYFSAGNLQYYCSSDSPQWRFAPTQTHICGTDNNNPSANTGKWIDLFGWGTSGNRETGTYPNFPYNTYTTSSYYGPVNSILFNEDWGQYLTGNSCMYYNELLFGSNVDYPWMTLNLNQWMYLLNPTGNEGRLINGEGGLGHTYSFVSVNGTIGLLIYHDEFYQIRPNTTNPVPTVNLSDYPGCAFLPFTGYRDVDPNVSDSSPIIYYPNASTAWYWTSDNAYNSNGNNIPSRAVALQMDYQSVYTSAGYRYITSSNQLRYRGLPVRLVCLIPPSTK